VQPASDTLSARFLASLETNSRLTESEALRCVYCEERITADDAAQRVSRKEYAHTTCAFRVNDEFFAEHDARRVGTQLRGGGGE
jgi:hypothetical protein